MKKLNITIQEALSVLDIPESEHARYIAAIWLRWRRTMRRAMEEMLNDTAFVINVAAIRKMMKKLNITIQQALNVLDIPESEHARYIAAIWKDKRYNTNITQ